VPWCTSQHTYIHIWARWAVIGNWWRTDGSYLQWVPPLPGTSAQDIMLLLLGLYHYAPPHDTSAYNSCFWGLIITHPTQYFIDDHHYKYNILPISISFSRPDVSCPFYSLLCNYQFIEISGAGQIQGVTRVHKYYRFSSLYIIQDKRSLYIIQDNKYKIPVNVIITGQDVIWQVADDKWYHDRSQVITCRYQVITCRW